MEMHSNQATDMDSVYSFDVDYDIEYYKRIELRCQATKKSYGFFDHYFIVIDDMELHMGVYKKGKILPKDTTKGSHIVANYELCKACYDKIIVDLKLEEDTRLFNAYFPILNCETLCTGFSFQSITIITVPFIFILFIKGLFLWAIILFLVTIVCLLGYSKYTFSHTKNKKCKHLST